MKKSVLFIGVLLFLLSCSKNDKSSQRQVENAIKMHMQMRDDTKSYNAMSFDKLDSIRLVDSKVYQQLVADKNNIEASIISIEEKMDKIEKEGVEYSNEEYNKLKNDLQVEIDKLKNVDYKFNKIQYQEYLYTVKHKYKAQKNEDNDATIYEDIFYVDKNGNLIEQIIIN